MKLIMENWRKFLREEIKKPATWKDISPKLEDKYSDVDVFYVQNDLIQRYSSKMYSLLAKRKGEDLIHHDAEARGFEVSPKGQSFSPELRWGYKHRKTPEMPDGERFGLGGSWGRAPAANMPKNARSQGDIDVYHGGGYHPHHGHDTDDDGYQRGKQEGINEFVMTMSGFIKAPGNMSRFPKCKPGECFDPAVVDEFVKFALFIPALEGYATLQHEIGHHIQHSFPADSWDLEMYKKVFKNAKAKFGVDADEILGDGKATGCFSPEIAVALDNRKLLIKALPRIISDFKRDNLPGDLKWKTWIDPHPESKKQFLALMTNKIQKIIDREIHHSSQYYEDEVSKVKDCLKQAKQNKEI